MMRSYGVLLALPVVLASCRSPSGCNPFGPACTRVPPPTTGSFGTGNTYYPAAIPRATVAPTIAPTGAPRALAPANGGWRSSTDNGQRAQSLATTNVGSELEGGNRTSGSTPGGAGTETFAARAPRTDTVSTLPRLNGMPVNEARSAVTQAAFTSRVSDQEPANFGSGGPGATAIRPKSTPSGTSNTLRDPATSASPAAGPERSATALPAPPRVAGM